MEPFMSANLRIWYFDRQLWFITTFDMRNISQILTVTMKSSIKPFRPSHYGSRQLLISVFMTKQYRIVFKRQRVIKYSVHCEHLLCVAPHLTWSKCTATVVLSFETYRSVHRWTWGRDVPYNLISLAYSKTRTYSYMPLRKLWRSIPPVKVPNTVTAFTIHTFSGATICG